jgi:hypothetical protein
MSGGSQAGVPDMSVAWKAGEIQHESQAKAHEFESKAAGMTIPLCKALLVGRR